MKKMIIIDLDRIREALPDRAKVELKKKKSVVHIECTVTDPPLSEEDFETCKKWQRKILGEAFMEFYTVSPFNPTIQCPHPRFSFTPSIR